ncbi:YhjD/YihY/BrkB family envelope integrity protein, partial [Streptomyces niveus]|uniref:YhjD/YihY/BrkB family envelope integrity protein n=1 Tax=Streptomyces niveus TaxID=193462 RepID=UPI000ABE9B64
GLVAARGPPEQYGRSQPRQQDPHRNPQPPPGVPRRDQPGYTWLAFGSAVHLLLWVGATWLLTLYVGFSGSFGSVYGPLTAFVALLLWSQLAGISLFLGLSLAAQLESARAGQHDPVHPDPGHGGDPDHV